MTGGCASSKLFVSKKKMETPSDHRRRVLGPLRPTASVQVRNSFTLPIVSVPLSPFSSFLSVDASQCPTGFYHRRSSNLLPFRQHLTSRLCYQTPFALDT